MTPNYDDLCIVDSVKYRVYILFVNVGNNRCYIENPHEIVMYVTNLASLHHGVDEC